MTKEKQTVSGEVVATKDWKSGKGSWVNFRDDSNDFYAYKGKVPNVGETGTWEVKEGTGILADKVELVALVEKSGPKTAAEEYKKEALAVVEKSIESGERTYFERQELIVRQCCIKAAADVTGHIGPKAKEITPANVANMVIEIADLFYGWITHRDEKLPEPPEEP